MKKKTSLSKDDTTMSFDLFEREYANAITWQVEMLIEDGQYDQEDYDDAYEHAVEIVAAEEGINLI